MMSIFVHRTETAQQPPLSIALPPRLTQEEQLSPQGCRQLSHGQRRKARLFEVLCLVVVTSRIYTVDHENRS